MWSSPGLMESCCWIRAAQPIERGMENAGYPPGVRRKVLNHFPTRTAGLQERGMPSPSHRLRHVLTELTWDRSELGSQPPASTADVASAGRGFAASTSHAQLIRWSSGLGRALAWHLGATYAGIRC